MKTIRGPSGIRMFSPIIVNKSKIFFMWRCWVPGECSYCAKADLFYECLEIDIRLEIDHQKETEEKDSGESPWKLGFSQEYISESRKWKLMDKNK